MSFRDLVRLQLNGRVEVSVADSVIKVLDGVLNLKGRASGFTEETRLLGHVPELDSMAVLSVITGLEERFGFVIEDDEIDGSTFQTVGTLTQFVQSKLGT